MLFRSQGLGEYSNQKRQGYDVSFPPLKATQAASGGITGKVDGGTSSGGSNPVKANVSVSKAASVVPGTSASTSTDTQRHPTAKSTTMKAADNNKDPKNSYGSGTYASKAAEAAEVAQKANEAVIQLEM